MVASALMDTATIRGAHIGMIFPEEDEGPHFERTPRLMSWSELRAAVVAGVRLFPFHYEQLWWQECDCFLFMCDAMAQLLHSKPSSAIPPVVHKSLHVFCTSFPASSPKPACCTYHRCPRTDLVHATLFSTMTRGLKHIFLINHSLSLYLSLPIPCSAFSISTLSVFSWCSLLCSRSAFCCLFALPHISLLRSPAVSRGTLLCNHETAI